MSLQEIAALAASNDSMTGYFGRKKAWLAAQHAAQNVTLTHSRLAAYNLSERCRDGLRDRR